ncbi:DNA photolyase phr1 [Microbotryomycetes sp. JL221]|nr:DNA photolyase phr1 [Microbotryomycetes sp. JL221]
MAPKRKTSSSASPEATSKRPKSDSKANGSSPKAKQAKLDRPKTKLDELDDGLDVMPEEMRDTPYAKLYDAMASSSKYKATAPSKDGVVVYWMRNKDMRITDNRALSHASGFAQKHKLPLVVLYVISPGDFKSHDRAPRRIDFMLRQLQVLQPHLDSMNIPLYTVSWEPRKQIPTKMLELMQEWDAAALFGNIEHEVDELGRDIEIITKTSEARQKKRGWRGEVAFMADMCVVPPGKVLTKQGKPYSVYSPWYRNWAETVTSDLMEYVGDCGKPEANDKSARDHAVIGKLLGHDIPKEVKSFELTKEDKEAMNHLFPLGDGIVDKIMHRFLRTKIRENVFFEPPLHHGAEDAKDPLKDSKIGKYQTGRNDVSLDGTSHISPYLAAGVVSPRELLRMTMELTKNKLVTERDANGIGMWVTEVAWRDFYQHVLVAWPRVCMRKPFNLKFEHIAWEENEDHFKAWCDGQTGYPIVDAAMRSIKTQGYMHNRARMIVAMFLSKDLMMDWRKGEKFFMQNLIDGDFGSNNGGWQWSSSTGTDPQPYFRIFAPLSQSKKSDPNGTYIRHWVPELKDVKGDDIHDPPAAIRKKVGYPLPIVDHAQARKRAIARFKNPGERLDE